MKNDLQKLRSARISGVGSASCGVIAIAVLLSSCNLIFLPGMGFEDEAPEFESVEASDEDTASGALWPTFQAMIQDDFGIKSLSCTVQTGQGDTESLTIDRTDERERYVWRVSGSLADFVSAGLNTLTFTATDVAGNTVEQETYLYLDAGVAGLKWSIDSTRTPRVASLWHPSGIASVTYHYVGDESNERALDNADDGTGDGGDKFFMGTLAAFDPPSLYSQIVFTVTEAASGSSLTTGPLYL